MDTSAIDTLTSVRRRQKKSLGSSQCFLGVSTLDQNVILLAALQWQPIVAHCQPAQVLVGFSSMFSTSMPSHTHTCNNCLFHFAFQSLSAACLVFLI